MRKNKKIVLTAVTQDGMLLQYADRVMKCDKDVVLAAIAQNGSALQHVDPAMTSDEEILGVLLCSVCGGRLLQVCQDCVARGLSGAAAACTFAWSTCNDVFHSHCVLR